MTIIYLHIITVTAALILGTVQLARPKGTGSHRVIGYITAGLFITTALLSFGILELYKGSLSWLHLLAVLTIVSMVQGIRTARQGNMSAHRAWMRNTFIGAGIAGAVALTPDRFIGSLLL